MPRAAEDWVGGEEIARRLNDSIIVDVAEAIAMILELASLSCGEERAGAIERWQSLGGRGCSCGVDRVRIGGYEMTETVPTSTNPFFFLVEEWR